MLAEFCPNENVNLNICFYLQLLLPNLLPLHLALLLPLPLLLLPPALLHFST